MADRLTEVQRKRLRVIGAYKPTTEWPHAAFWKSSRTDQSLVTRGFVERIEHETVLTGSLRAVFNLCRITPAGRRALQSGGDE